MLSFLNILRLSVFGESHGEAIGMTLEGLPAGHEVSFEAVQAFADRRKSRAAFATPRKEEDRIEFLSGFKDNRTSGTPVAAVIRNTNAKSADYTKLKNIPRPSHCDYAAGIKYNANCDLSGGGHFSGRLTAPLCIAGGIAGQMIAPFGIRTAGYISELGGKKFSSYRDKLPALEEILAAQRTALPVLGEENRKQAESLLNDARASGDSIGGVAELIVFNAPAGLGGPLYEGLEGRLAAMLYAIPAVKGVEFGAGFLISSMKGSEANDPFYYNKSVLGTRTNHSGGINGGISNGMPITMRIAFRPTPSISLPQESVDLESKENVVFTIGGRHDACVVPRAIVCTEAVANLVLLDAILENQVQSWRK
jgi:chorismate synthase